MAHKYIAGDTGRKHSEGEHAGKSWGEPIKIGSSHFTSGDEIPQSTIDKLDPKTLEADIKRGFIKRVGAEAEAPKAEKPVEAKK